MKCNATLHVTLRTDRNSEQRNTLIIVVLLSERLQLKLTRHTDIYIISVEWILS